MAIGVAVYPRSRAVSPGEGFPTPPITVAPKVLDLEHWVQLEPALEPALSFGTPEDLSNDLLLKCARIGHTLMSSVDMDLPSPATQLIERITWSSLGAGWSVLASEVEVSNITGCWGSPEAYRNDKGYAFTWDPASYEIETRQSGEFRAMRLHQVAYTLMRRQFESDFELPPYTPLDHTCRFSGCCNPGHVIETDTVENNRRQRVAHPVESALLAGQVMVAPTGYEQIDAIVAAAPSEDTNLVINTRHGPYRVIKVDDEPLRFYGEPEEDNLLPLMRPPANKLKHISGEDLTLMLNGKKPLPCPKRKSRAITPKILENQLTMFHPTRYRKMPLHKKPHKTTSKSKVTIDSGLLN